MVTRINYTTYNIQVKTIYLTEHITINTNGRNTHKRNFLWQIKYTSQIKVQTKQSDKHEATSNTNTSRDGDERMQLLIFLKYTSQIKAQGKHFFFFPIQPNIFLNLI